MCALIRNFLFNLQAKLAQDIIEKLESSNPDEKKNGLTTLSTIAEVCLS